MIIGDVDANEEESDGHSDACDDCGNEYGAGCSTDGGIGSLVQMSVPWASNKEQGPTDPQLQQGSSCMCGRAMMPR